MDIQKTLEDHKMWVLTEGKAGIKADLHGAYLRDVNLQGAYLRFVNLRYAYLRYAYLHGTDLHGAYLHGADLRGARGILQWQAPQGEKRICYSVKHDDCVMHKIECFWGTTDEALGAIRKKYGEDSLYEKFLLMQVEALEGE